MEDEENIIAQLEGQGVDVSIFDDSFLLKSLKKRMTLSGNHTVKDYCNYLQQIEDEASIFLDSLNVNFSEFFRNTLAFACLEQIVLPKLIEKKRKGKEIRIWSAACSAGQEAYSIAILFDELIERTKSNKGYRIFATDINQKELIKSKKGVYNRSVVGNVTLNRIQTYFTQRGETFTIRPNLKKHIDFSFFDLLQGDLLSPSTSIFGEFDLVFCSNLLFYYNPESRQRILEKITNNLAPGGYLITDNAEREIVKGNGFREVFVNSAIFQKR
jgi:chemotaxis protein methyltransferase CheR